MANLTDAYELEVLDTLTGVTPLNAPTIVYVALFTADPTDEGSVVNEVFGGGYARTSINAKFEAGASATTSNTAQIDFPTATADWPTVTHVGMMKSDIEGNGDMMVWIALDSPITISNTQVFSFSIGNLTINAGVVVQVA